MKAPDKIYVEVCEDGIFAFPEPPFEESIEYVRADLVSCPKLSDNSLEETAERQINEALFKWSYDDEDGIEQYVHDAFIAGAKWRYQKDRAEFAKLKAKEWSDGYNEGITKGKEQMMKDAVEADVNIYRDLAAGKSWAEFVVEMPTNNLGDKVRVIIVKEDER